MKKNQLLALLLAAVMLLAVLTGLRLQDRARSG